MATERDDRIRKEEELARQAAKEGDTGLPGGGQGRRDQTGITNVYPASGPAKPPGDARLQPMGTWGQADRGPEGYEDSGDSEIIPNERFTEKEPGEKKKAKR
jgi:hypothetical protein